MKTLQCCQPRQSVLDGSEDFVVNLTALQELTEAEAVEFPGGSLHVRNRW